MTRRKGKPVSFDAMIKFFIQYYNIPTKKDLDRLMARIDRIENLIRTAASAGKVGRPAARSASRDADAGIRGALTATDVVEEIITGSREGIGFPEIKDKTGFPEKKLRNIIFRLDKIGRIKRKSRGIYSAP